MHLRLESLDQKIHILAAIMATANGRKKPSSFDLFRPHFSGVPEEYNLFIVSLAVRFLLDWGKTITR